MIRAAFATCLLALALAPAAMAEEAPTGYWLTEKKGVVVNLYECGGALCGRTVWMKKMSHKDGAPRLDAKNPDPALRSRHWCGIEVITDVAAQKPGHWDDGEVYDPKTGETFDFEIKRQGEKLKVRGYLGVKVLGKSETWTRTDPAGLKLCAS